MFQIWYVKRFAVTTITHFIQMAKKKTVKSRRIFVQIQVIFLDMKFDFR